MIELVLYRCDECSNVKAFTPGQIADFDIIICSMYSNQNGPICTGTMERLKFAKNNWNDVLITFENDL